MKQNQSKQLEYLWSRLYGLLTQKKFVLPEKVGQCSPKFFRGCYLLRPPIMSNFIEIGQTSLEKGGGSLDLGQKKLFCNGLTET